MINILSKSASIFPPARIVYREKDIDYILFLIKQALKSGILTQGPLVETFESEVCRWTGTKTVAVGSATSGLEIILRVLNVAGKEVIVPANTFVATAAAALHAGASVKFVDIEAETYALDPEKLAKAISPRTAAVIIVHIGGFISNRIEEIKKICQKRNVFLVEDSAQALGSYFQGKSAATFGIAGAFSFFPTKIISTGEGGMVATSDKRIKKQAKILRNHGKNSREECVALGYNWRLSEINAAVGLGHLRALPSVLAKKKKVAEYYNRHLSGFPGLRVTQVKDSNQNYYKYIALLDSYIDKQKLKKILLTDYNISLSGDVFSQPCSSLAIFKEKKQYPVAEWFCKSHICLPIYPDMTLEEAKFVIKALERGLKKFNRISA